VAQAAGEAHSGDVTMMRQPRKHPQHQLLRQVGELDDGEATPLFIHQQTDLANCKSSFKVDKSIRKLKKERKIRKKTNRGELKRMRTVAVVRWSVVALVMAAAAAFLAAGGWRVFVGVGPNYCTMTYMSARYLPVAVPNSPHADKYTLSLYREANQRLPLVHSPIAFCFNINLFNQN
jgi:hypothetical protein